MLMKEHKPTQAEEKSTFQVPVSDAGMHKAEYLECEPLDNILNFIQHFFGVKAVLLPYW